MKLIPRKPINHDDTLGRGMDMALVTLVFLGLGWLVDNWLGTKPAFMIGLVVFSLIGQFVKMWYAYDAEMQRHENERRVRSTSTAAREPSPRPSDRSAA